MLDDLMKDAQSKMDKAIEAFDRDLKTLRTGRATTSVLDNIRVPAYGSESPIQQIANVTTPDASTIVIQPWDPSVMAAIEKAIKGANIGLTPTNDGKIIRLSMPQLTQEKRKEIVKQAHALAEHARVAIRNVRRHVNDEIKAKEKKLAIPEDDKKKMLDNVQKKTDEHVKKVDAMLAKKEAEIMKV